MHRRLFQVSQFKTATTLAVPITGPMIALVERTRAAGATVGDRLLLHTDGRPYDQRLISEHLRNHLDYLGLRHLSFHGLRYAAAGRLRQPRLLLASQVRPRTRAARMCNSPFQAMLVRVRTSGGGVRKTAQMRPTTQPCRLRRRTT